MANNVTLVVVGIVAFMGGMLAMDMINDAELSLADRQREVAEDHREEITDRYEVVRTENEALQASHPAIVSDPLFLAVVKVESGGRLDAVGQDGELGPAQIRPICVDDINRILGPHSTQFSLDDRRSLEKSWDMFRTYTDHYGGKDASDEVRARIWNGGPRGHQKSATLAYWLKVERSRDLILEERHRGRSTN